MTIRLKWVLCCLCLPSLSSAAEIDAGELFSELFSGGEIVADEMAVRGTPEQEQLARKFNRAAAANRDRLNALRETLKPGEPLPYRSWFGITEVEYKSFLESKPKPVKVGTKKLSVRTTGSGYFSFFSSDAPAFSNIVFIADENLLLMKDQPFVRGADIHAGPDTAFGAWDGVRWSKQIGEPGSAKSVSVELNVGRLKEGARGLVRIHIRSARGRQEQILMFNIAE